MRPQPCSHTFHVRRALLRFLAPRYQQASPAQKTLLLDACVKKTGYTRKYAIELLNQEEQNQQIIQRHRLPQDGQAVQQALFLAWKATHYVCAKRLVPFLPSLVVLLEGQGHLQLTEEEHRQVLAMSVSTAERFLRTQHKPRVQGLSTTTPGRLCKAQLPVCLFSPWKEDHPGFVEMDLVAHCGDHLDGRFLYTLTLTDLATGWTECLPLREKSADAVLAAFQQARTLFPFPLLGIDTDSGSEFLNEDLIAFCEQERITFTHGRPAVKNDQAHVEQKNGAVVREAVGYARLVGVQASQQLGEVYQALRLVVNYFQPSLKLQTTVLKGEHVRRVYDVAQTPLQRLLASGVLPEERQWALREQMQQIDPLALSAYLDALRHALLCGACLLPAVLAEGDAWPPLRFCLAACSSEARPPSEEEPERTDQTEASSSCEECQERLQAHPERKSTQVLQEIGCLAPERTGSAPEETLMHDLSTICPSRHSTWQDSGPPEHLQGELSESFPPEPHRPEEVSEVSQSCTQAHTLPAPVPGTPSNTDGEHEASHRARITLEQAIAAYLQEMRDAGRNPKTLQWHHTSLGALRRYLWRQFHLTDVCALTSACLQTWVSDLPFVLSVRTGVPRTVSTVSAYVRSARAFCNWLVRQGYVSEPFFPKEAVPHVQRGVPHPVEPEAFVHLLRACQLTGPLGGAHASMTARNRAILWLFLETGLSISELCSVRLADVDRAGGTVTVQGTRGHPRIFPLSADGLRAVCAYLDQARLTPAWEPAVPEAQDRLLLTERGYPLTKNSLTLLFARLSQRAGFSRTPICASMLRDTYAIHFLQTEGELATLQKQLGVACLVSVKRYQRFCEQRRQGSHDHPGEGRAHVGRNQHERASVAALREKGADCGAFLVVET